MAPYIWPNEMDVIVQNGPEAIANKKTANRPIGGFFYLCKTGVSKFAVLQ
jgi:hypothetical protein